MSVVFHKEDSKICPRCNEDEVVRIDIIDKNFAKNNGLTSTEAIDISDDCTFSIDVCKACGFKWVFNDGVASTSQLKSMLLSSLISTICTCEISALKVMIDDLDRVSGIPANRKNELYIAPSEKNADAERLTLLELVSEYLESCDLDTLVEMYNNEFGASDYDVSEAINPNDNDELTNRATSGISVSVNEVIIDD